MPCSLVRAADKLIGSADQCYLQHFADFRRLYVPGQLSTGPCTRREVEKAWGIRAEPYGPYNPVYRSAYLFCADCSDIFIGDAWSFAPATGSCANTPWE